MDAIVLVLKLSVRENIYNVYDKAATLSLLITFTINSDACSPFGGILLFCGLSMGAIVAADLDAIGTQTPIAFIDRAIRPSCRRSTPPTQQSSSKPWAFITR
jgi:hypothetical protein